MSGDIMNGNNPTCNLTRRAGRHLRRRLLQPVVGQTGDWLFQNAAGQSFGVGYNSGGSMWVKINVTFFNQTHNLPR
jgi:hypothetical protein